MNPASNLNSKKLIIITGPTGSGKTDLSIAIAKHFGTEIINCDSRQVYKELGVAVAKPSKEHLEAIKHHFVSSHSIYEKPISAGSFAQLALEKLNLIFKEKDVAVLCGGTGFYISALLNGFTVSDGEDKEIHRKYILITITSLAKCMRILFNIGFYSFIPFAASFWYNKIPILSLCT